ncbi:MAG: organic solvent tolerance protein OstA [Prolixibacteraceae bacterium]|nr:organic solvent tolerance protein OstA [Prolixibacteraceae bacterium]
MEINMHKHARSILSVITFVTTILLILSCPFAFSQSKTKKTISIDNADSLLYNEAIIKNAQRLLGNVKMTHKEIVVFCDSAWSYSSSNTVDAFGNVHIIKNDTLHMWARYIHYNGDKGMAKARNKVKLKDPGLTLTTDSLDFDMKEEIGYYNFGGTIVDSTNTLTSIVGRYYSKEKELFFKDSVRLVNDDYVMTSDTMRYNTETEIVHILGPTHIIGDSTYLYSENGWFDTKNNLSELLKNSTVRRGDTQLEADYIFYDDNTGDGTAKGDVIINDFANKIIITGNNTSYNDFSKYAQVTDSAVFIQCFESDSLFLHADTLQTKPDTVGVNQKIFTTFYNVRYYKNDMQGICDSLIYYTNDSITQLYNEPVLWSENNQMSADFIEVVTNSEPTNYIYLKNNSFIVQEVDTSKYNQIKGKNMVGHIIDNDLKKIDVNGNGQSIYYPVDEEDYIGVNRAESSNIVLYLKENKIHHISFIKSPTGVMKPLLEQASPETRLEGFKWRNNERPISKYDIFRDKNGTPVPQLLPKSEIRQTLPVVKGLREKTLSGPDIPIKPE